MSSRINIERSREIRQWIGLGFKAVGGFISIDLLFNNGAATDKIVNGIKNKAADIRAKMAKRKENSDVVNL